MNDQFVLCFEWEDEENEKINSIDPKNILKYGEAKKNSKFKYFYTFEAVLSLAIDLKTLEHNLGIFFICNKGISQSLELKKKK